jgi:hypothetical protein
VAALDSLRPSYRVQVTSSGGLDVRCDSATWLELELRRLREMGLEEGIHYTVNASKNGRRYIYIRREGLARAAWLSARGSGRQRELAADFVERILQRAREAGEEAYRKASEIVEEGRARGSLTLKGLKKEVWVGGRRRVVEAFGCMAAVGGSGLLHVAVWAKVDGVEDVYVLSFGRFGRTVWGFAAAKAYAPGGKEADAERLLAVVKALTGERPKAVRRGKIKIKLSMVHLSRLARYAELAEAVETWLTEAER